MSINDYINCLDDYMNCGTVIMVSCPVMKINKLLLHSTIWMNYRHIMLKKPDIRAHRA